MTRKQLIALFICYLIPFVAGNALVPLLPIYANQLGADSGLTGVYMAIIFAALAIGTLGSGWLSSRFQRRKTFIIAALVMNAVAVVAMGLVGNVALLTVATAVVWLMSGIQTAMIHILTGIYADENRRGQTFGIISAAGALAQLIGGLMAGAVVERWGFMTLFGLLSALYLAGIVAALFLDDSRADSRATQEVKTAGVSVKHNGFMLLMYASVLVYVANFAYALGKTLVMGDLEFSATTISMTVAISGAINLPMPFLMGWMSDRVGRKPIVIGSYLFVALGVGMLMFSTMVWQFWLSQVFISMLISGQAAGSALITDIVPKKALSTSLARYAAAPWIGAVIGYATSGFALQSLGTNTAFAFFMMLPILAVALVGWTQRRGARLTARSQPASA
jgi:MFS family permease